MIDKTGTANGDIGKMNNPEQPYIDNVADILALIGPARSVAISAHTYPDGDAVGSCLAMAEFLRAIGKEVSVLLPKKDIGNVRVLEGFADIVDPDAFDFAAPPDLFVCLDCADPSRICDERIRGWVRQVPTLNIDHHGKALFGTRNYVVKDASSTGELVCDVARAAGWAIGQRAAEALWCAIVTDTCRFSTPSTTPDTLRCAADLVSAGVRVSFLNDAIYQNETPAVFELRTRAMRSLERWCGGRATAISLTSADFAETGCTKQDAEEFPLIPRSIAGSVLSFYFYPFPVDNPTGARISARSREDAPVTALQVAEHFGGAGHTHSAGAVFPGDVVAAAAAVHAYLDTVLDA